MSSLTEESEDRAQTEQCARNKHAHLLLEQSSQSPAQQHLLRKEAEVQQTGSRWSCVLNRSANVEDRVWLNQVSCAS